MKNGKGLPVLSFILAFCLVLTGIPGAVRAEGEDFPSGSVSLSAEENLSGITDATYTTAKRYIQILKEKELTYSTYPAESDDDYDQIDLKFNVTSEGGKDFSYRGSAFFRSKNDRMSLRVFNLIDFEESDLNQVLRVCSQLNNRYLWVKFFVDESDFSVTASYDLPLQNASSDMETMWDAYDNLHSIVKLAYDDLVIYAK